MTIEQVVGGFSESVLSQFILTMGILVEYATNLRSVLHNIRAAVNAWESRISRDVDNLKKLSQFFGKFNSFPEVNTIMSINFGVMGGNSINCYQASEIGKKSAQVIIGHDFGRVTFQTKKKMFCQ